VNRVQKGKAADEANPGRIRPTLKSFSQWTSFSVKRVRGRESGVVLANINRLGGDSQSISPRSKLDRSLDLTLVETQLLPSLARLRIAPHIRQQDPRSQERDLHPVDEDLSTGTPDLGHPAPRARRPGGRWLNSSVGAR
jgi:hypothetical protein